MKESFGTALGNAIVQNLAKNADVDPRRIAFGLVVTAASTALTVVTKSVTRRAVVKAIRMQEKRKAEAEAAEIIPELEDAESSDED